MLQGGGSAEAGPELKRRRGPKPAMAQNPASAPVRPQNLPKILRDVQKPQQPPETALRNSYAAKTAESEVMSA